MHTRDSFSLFMEFGGPLKGGGGSSPPGPPPLDPPLKGGGALESIKAHPIFAYSITCLNNYHGAHQFTIAKRPLVKTCWLCPRVCRSRDLLLYFNHRHTTWYECGTMHQIILVWF